MKSVMWKVQRRPGVYIDHPIRITEDKKNYYVGSMWHPDLLEEFRAMKGSRWDKEKRIWVVPKNERNDYTFSILEGEYPTEYYGDSLAEVTKTISKNYPIFPWQQEGIAFVLAHKRCMLAFEMGLGKTLTMIRVMEYLAINLDICIWWLVAPYGAQQSWRRELVKWDAKVEPLVFTTYESLKNHVACGKPMPQGIIFDESIKLQTPTSQRSQVAYQVCKEIRKNNGFIIELTGAPAPKDPSCWWHQIECLQPGFIREGDIHKFRNRLANIVYEEGEFGKYPVIESWKEDEVELLGKRLAPIVLRKKKANCLELPDKIYDIISVTPSEETLRVARMLVKEGGIIGLMKLRELSDGFQYEDGPSQACTWVGSPKTNIVKELLDFYHTENGGCGRLVIYTVFHATNDYLTKLAQDEGWKAYRIDGRGWSSDVLATFDNEVENVVLVCHPGAVHGLNLQRTEALIYYSNDFSVDSRIQSEDRRDRPGMSNKGTKIIDIVHLETDRLILEKLRSRKGLQNITLEEIERCLKI